MAQGETEGVKLTEADVDRLSETLTEVVGLGVPLPRTELLDEGLSEALRLAAVLDGEVERELEAVGVHVEALREPLAVSVAAPLAVGVRVSVTVTDAELDAELDWLAAGSHMQQLQPDQPVHPQSLKPPFGVAETQFSPMSKFMFPGEPR